MNSSENTLTEFQPVERKFQLKELHSRHKEIIRRRALGQTPGEIAAELGISVAMVGYTTRGELGAERLGELEQQRDAEFVSVSKRIASIVPKALAFIDKILDDDCSVAGATPVVRLAAARDVLDRAGYAPVKKVDVNNGGALTAEILAKIKERAINAGVCIDVKSERVGATKEASDAA